MRDAEITRIVTPAEFGKRIQLGCRLSLVVEQPDLENGCITVRFFKVPAVRHRRVNERSRKAR